MRPDERRLTGYRPIKSETVSAKRSPNPRRTASRGDRPRTAGAIGRQARDAGRGVGFHDAREPSGQRPQLLAQLVVGTRTPRAPLATIASRDGQIGRDGLGQVRPQGLGGGERFVGAGGMTAQAEVGEVGHRAGRPAVTVR
jgi:hypothetical protein